MAVGRSDILHLASLMEAGHLISPFGELALRHHLRDDHTAAVAEFFRQLDHQGMTATQIALLLRAFVAGQVNNEQSHSTEVVISGPDMPGTARETGVVMRQLFNEVQRHILVVGFVVNQGKSVFSVLAERLDNDHSIQAKLCIDVRREHGNTTETDGIVRRFAQDFVRYQWPGDRLPEVYYDPRSLDPTQHKRSALHAKCVSIDGQAALVTSANFTEAAQQRNIELGVLIRSRDIARRIEEHFTHLIQGSHLVRLILS